MMTRDVSVGIHNVVKRYGSFTALHGVSLDIRENEFFTLLGPSGCGKTTLLRCIAGFEDVSEGSIHLNDTDLTGLKAHERPVNTVFQQYALFPHMTVEENVMFGLRRSGWSRREAVRRADDMLKLVQMTEYANRKPTQLSGGQQQRVALARALAPRPKVLLLDEPLSALDLKLRQAVRMQLKEIQRETGIAFVFVTHDQEEALTMSDRIAVMSKGYVQQTGTPKEIYEAPVNRFVADFIGETNFLDVEVQSVTDGIAQIVLPGGHPFSCPAAAKVSPGKGHLSVRPERISVCAPDQSDLRGTVTDQTYLGTDTHVQLKLDDGEDMTVRMQNSESMTIPAMGDVVGLKLEAGAASLLID
ncbi:Spermidine/putrescine import ATP-binding protein PotA [Vibrio aerogenes CECT 7868]|uniref:Spermidine/putrescine import ATP-binding protein PotA n=1 Tax=Vibrio aerogenes CECT 7868 TaxID=1216006 RepID=A0A1M6AHB2_9VIBR|nr:ABC transporter ATP-binding protein [Vibrio aerogenes]SHI35807.1 Spermidine/putrescine import ATP-binding protein PotA [Vibrio aerogenes CECT 7868]